MTLISLPERCTYTFPYLENLWRTPAICGVVLLLVSMLLVWMMRASKLSSSRFLVGALVLSSMGALALSSFAFVSLHGMHYIDCIVELGNRAILIDTLIKIAVLMTISFIVVALLVFLQSMIRSGRSKN